MINLNDDSIGQYADVNGLRMYYEEYGSGHPLILLHGGTGNAKISWASFRSYLSNHFRVITPDCRGQGKTDNPTEEFSYQLMAADIVALIKELGLESPFVGGWSDGGQITLQIGIYYPDLVKAFIVGGALIEISEPYLDGLRAWGMEGPGVIDFDKIERKHSNLVKILKEIHSSVYGPEYWKKLLVDISKMWFNPEEFPGESISKISVPTLVLHADHDELVPLEQAVKIFKLIPKAELAVIPNMKHLTISSKPEIFAPIIIDFLQRHEKENEMEE